MLSLSREDIWSISYFFLHVLSLSTVLLLYVLNIPYYKFYYDLSESEKKRESERVSTLANLDPSSVKKEKETKVETKKSVIPELDEETIQIKEKLDSEEKKSGNENGNGNGTNQEGSVIELTSLSNPTTTTTGDIPGVNIISTTNIENAELLTKSGDGDGDESDGKNDDEDDEDDTNYQRTDAQSSVYYQPHTKKSHILLILYSLVSVFGVIIGKPSKAARILWNIEISAYDAALLLITSIQVNLFIYFFVSFTLPIYFRPQKYVKIVSYVDLLQANQKLNKWISRIMFWFSTLLLVFVSMALIIGNVDPLQQRSHLNDYAIQSYSSFAAYLVLDVELFSFLIYFFVTLYQLYRITRNPKHLEILEGELNYTYTGYLQVEGVLTTSQKGQFISDIVWGALGKHFWSVWIGWTIFFMLTGIQLLNISYEISIFIFFHVTDKYSLFSLPKDNIPLDILRPLTDGFFLLFMVYSVVIFFRLWNTERSVFLSWKIGVSEENTSLIFKFESLEYNMTATYINEEDFLNVMYTRLGVLDSFKKFWVDRIRELKKIEMEFKLKEPGALEKARKREKKIEDMRKQEVLINKKEKEKDLRQRFSKHEKERKRILKEFAQKSNETVNNKEERQNWTPERAKNAFKGYLRANVEDIKYESSGRDYLLLYGINIAGEQDQDELAVLTGNRGYEYDQNYGGHEYSQGIPTTDSTGFSPKKQQLKQQQQETEALSGYLRSLEAEKEEKEKKKKEEDYKKQNQLVDQDSTLVVSLSSSTTPGIDESRSRSRRLSSSGGEGGSQNQATSPLFVRTDSEISEPSSEPTTTGGLGLGTGVRSSNFKHNRKQLGLSSDLIAGFVLEQTIDALEIDNITSSGVNRIDMKSTSKPESQVFYLPKKELDLNYLKVFEPSKAAKYREKDVELATKLLKQAEMDEPAYQQEQEQRMESSATKVNVKFQLLEKEVGIVRINTTQIDSLVTQQKIGDESKGRLKDKEQIEMMQKLQNARRYYMEEQEKEKNQDQDQDRDKKKGSENEKEKNDAQKKERARESLILIAEEIERSLELPPRSRHHALQNMNESSLNRFLDNLQKLITSFIVLEFEFQTRKLVFDFVKREDFEIRYEIEKDEIIKNYKEELQEMYRIEETPYLLQENKKEDEKDAMMKAEQENDALKKRSFKEWRNVQRENQEKIDETRDSIMESKDKERENEIVLKLEDLRKERVDIKKEREEAKKKGGQEKKETVMSSLQKMSVKEMRTSIATHGKLVVSSPLQMALDKKLKQNQNITQSKLKELDSLYREIEDRLNSKIELLTAMEAEDSKDLEDDAEKKKKMLKGQLKKIGELERNVVQEKRKVELKYETKKKKYVEEILETEARHQAKIMNLSGDTEMSLISMRKLIKDLISKNKIWRSITSEITSFANRFRLLEIEENLRIRIETEFENKKFKELEEMKTILDEERIQWQFQKKEYWSQRTSLDKNSVDKKIERIQSKSKNEQEYYRSKIFGDEEKKNKKPKYFFPKDPSIHRIFEKKSKEIELKYTVQMIELEKKWTVQKNLAVYEETNHEQLLTLTQTEKNEFLLGMEKYFRDVLLFEEQKLKDKEISEAKEKLEKKYQEGKAKLDIECAAKIEEIIEKKKETFQNEDVLKKRRIENLYADIFGKGRKPLSKSDSKEEKDTVSIQVSNLMKSQRSMETRPNSQSGLLSMSTTSLKERDENIFNEREKEFKERSRIIEMESNKTVQEKDLEYDRLISEITKEYNEEVLKLLSVLQK